MLHSILIKSQSLVSINNRSMTQSRKWNTTHHKSTVNKRRKRSDEREECVLHSLRSFITILFFHHSLHSLPTTEDDWSTVRNGWINSIEISKRSMIPVPFVLFVYNEWRMNEAWNKEHERNQLFTFIIFLPFSLFVSVPFSLPLKRNETKEKEEIT